eukprot:745829-Hanusia_phi.AAC.6
MEFSSPMHEYRSILISKKKKTALLTAEYIRSLFFMRQQDAADMLVSDGIYLRLLAVSEAMMQGFSTTTMKHVCRRLGIRKWPYSRTRTSQMLLPDDSEISTERQSLESPASVRDQSISPDQSIDKTMGQLRTWDDVLKETMEIGDHERWSAEMGELFKDALEHLDCC